MSASFIYSIVLQLILFKIFYDGEVMMKKTKLAKAVAIAATGAVLTLGLSSTASAHVMYNTGIYGATDGWTLSDGRDNTGTVNPWKGTAGGVRPFGYEGKQALNWAATIHSAGSALEVSQADSIADYGFAADIDTANGAWGSWQVDPTNPSFTRGWAHNTDFGLVKSHIDTDIRIDVSKVNAGDDLNNFGITVLQEWMMEQQVLIIIVSGMQAIFQALMKPLQKQITLLERMD